MYSTASDEERSGLHSVFFGVFGQIYEDTEAMLVVPKETDTSHQRRGGIRSLQYDMSPWNSILHSQKDHYVSVWLFC